MADRLNGQIRCAGLVAAALLTMVLTLPVAVWAQNTEANPVIAVATAGSGAPALQTRQARMQAASLEKHLSTLHSKLHITPAQEPLWQDVAAAMRDNVSQLDSVYAQREKDFNSMSAVDDLKSYGQVQDTHARNVQSLIGPFQALYASFSVAQKKQADETFRTFTENAVKNPR